MTNIDLSKVYWKYADDALNDRIVVGHLIKQACQRMIDWASRDDIYFDYEDVDRKIRFVQKIKHYEGPFAGKPFNMLPYQQWMFANIYGWKFVDEDNLRVVNNVFILTTRQTGKSFLGAAIALVGAVCDGEAAPEISFIANSAKQAAILFKHCKAQAESLDPKGKVFSRYLHQIKIPSIKGSITILSADTKKLDGRHDSVFIRDEGHEAKTNDTWNIIKTGQVSRKNPLAISISTAGFNVGSAYPLYRQWEYCCNILNGIAEDDTWFAAIYQLDPEDDWKDENVWIKACPSLGVTIPLRQMREQIKTAINMPSEEVNIRTKNLNQWMQSSSVWISYDKIAAVMEPVNIEDYRRELAFGGVDLSVVDDLTCHSICIPPNPKRALHPDKFIFKSWIYIPEEALNKSTNKENYREWIRRGFAFKTSGDTVDYDEILKDQYKMTRNFTMLDIGYDQLNATQYVLSAQKLGMLMAQFSQTLGSFNRPTKFMQWLILSGKCIIDANPATEWMFGNVELMWDHYENCKPGKQGGPKSQNKIDCIISMLEALGCFLASKYYQPKLYVI